MDDFLSQSERDFRDLVRAFLDRALTPELRAAGRRCSGIFSDYAEGNAWHRILAAQGWSVAHWPVAHGGTDWSPMQHYLFARELAAADAPQRAPMGPHMVAPVIIAFGTDAQKAAWLPGIRSGEDYWCQGYSEPQAGSDLASLQCRAVRDGDDYVINGTKIWTTHAHYANRMFCLVRTASSGKPQQGISFLCFDMATPGISVRPILSMSGDHELNQVFFDDVRVPVAGRIGEENQGWSVAKYLLQHERGGAWSPLLRRRLARMRADALALKPARGGAWQDADLAVRLAAMAADIDALEASELLALRAQARGEPAGVAPSLGKIGGSELRQRLTELHLDIAGPQAAIALPLDACDNAQWPVPEASVFAMSAYLNDRAASIYAGTNEVQRNIVAAQLLAQGAPAAGRFDAPDALLEMLCESVTRYLAEHAPVPRAAAHSTSAPPQPPWWPGLAQTMGLTVAARPESQGGLGGGLATHLALIRVLGGALAAGPYLSSVVLGMGLFERLQGAESMAFWQTVLDGRATLAWAQTDAGSQVGDSGATRLHRDASGWYLSGGKTVVLGGSDATHFLVSAASDDGTAVLLLPATAPGLFLRPQVLRDGSRAADLRFDALRCDDAALLGLPGAAVDAAVAAVLDEATLAVCAEAIGVLTRLRDDTLDYVRQRKQFGAAIGGFQAVQHRLVDMHLALVQASALMARIEQAPPRTPEQLARTASSAKLVVARACRVVGQGAVQLHGGMGMTQELAVGHFFQRATLIEQQFGARSWHAHRLAALEQEPGFASATSELSATPAGIY